jgi:CheY-like chemotaxis protein
LRGTLTDVRVVCANTLRWAEAAESKLYVSHAVVMTGRPSKQVRELSIGAGAREVISKPFELESLKATLVRHLPEKAA